MPTQVLRYVNPASTGGDGTTNATSGATAAYASLSAALAAEFTARGTTLVSNDQYLTINCQGTTADANFTHSSSWTTDATHYVEIVVDTASRHAGVWNTGKYRISGSVNGNIVTISGIKNLRLAGLQVENTRSSGGTSVGGISVATAGTSLDIRVEQCLVRATGTPTSFSPGITCSSGNSGAYKVSSCIISGFTGATAISCGSNGPSHYLYRVTAVNGLRLASRANAAGTGRIKACIVAGCTDPDLILNGANWDSVDYCATDAASLGTGVPAGTGNRVSQTFLFAGASDWHLNTGDTAAKGFGTNLSADVDYPVTLDVDSIAIPAGGPYDIGADQVSTGATNNDPAHTTADVPSTQVVGSPRTVTVTARKSDGTPMTTGGATVAVTITGVNPATPTVTDVGNGTYTYSYVTATLGADTHAITLGGVAISGSPYGCTVVAGGGSGGVAQLVNGGLVRA